jgi:hypothetical protein
LAKLPKNLKKSKIIILELFSGTGGLGKSFKRLGFEVISYELFGATGDRMPDQDLSDSKVIQDIIATIEKRKFGYVHLGTPCSSFSRLRQLFRTSTRTRKRPQGDGSRPDEVLGNLLLKHSLQIIAACDRSGTCWTIENPKSSLLFAMPAMQTVMRTCHRVNFDQCMFGLCDPVSGMYRKPTTVLSNFLMPFTILCDKQHIHQEVTGSVSVEGRTMHRSKLAGAYPPALCDSWAKCVASRVRDNRAAAQHRRLKRLLA